MRLYRSVRVGSDESYPGGQIKNERGDYTQALSRLNPTDIALGEAIKDAPDDAIIRFEGSGKNQKVCVYVKDQENTQD